MSLQELLAEAARLDASDLHIIAGFPPTLRIIDKLHPVSGTSILSPQQTEELILSSCSPSQKELFLANKEVDFSLSTPHGRFRVNIYYQKGTMAGAFRLIPTNIRSIESLGLPQVLYEFTKLRQGLVLVTGPTGEGKSTTLASMIQHINETRGLHIITIEDPIEYVYSTGLSLISQREMHEDSHSWAVALRSVLREDPDVVLVGEMRDYETIAAALTVAETGHLVFATLHTNSASQTIDRIIDVFPEGQQQQIRFQLANTIEGVVSQRLVPALSGGRMAICEVMTGTPAVRSIIRDGKTNQLDNVILTSSEYSMISLEASLAKAVTDGKITVDVASSYAIRPEDLGKMIKRI
jgi:twitching motility protein PilT